jgi:uncharacterized protein DUF4238
MASNKNQHFVHKGYLRSFSSDSRRASIHLFNLKQRRAIPGASIRGQCSSSYFYGVDPRLEEALQMAEGDYGAFLHALKAPDYRLSEKHCEILRLFCLLQHSRTEAALKRNLAFMDGMSDAAYKGNPPPEMIPSKRQVVQMAMRTFAGVMKLVYDLKVRIVRNHTAIDFFTSDNPSVHTNKWHLQNPRAKHKTPGIASAGVLFFLPLTPRYLCMVYDGDVYTVQHRDGWIDVDRADEVAALNEQQLINCQENIYFANLASAEEIGQQYAATADRRPAQRHEIVTAILDRETDWGKHYKVVPQSQFDGEQGLIHIREILPVPTRWPRFLRTRPDAKIYSNNTGTGFVRAWSLAQGIYTGESYKRI